MFSFMLSCLETNVILRKFVKVLFNLWLPKCNYIRDIIVAITYTYSSILLCILQTQLY